MDLLMRVLVLVVAALLVAGPALAQSPAGDKVREKRLVLLIARFSQPGRTLATPTLAWMCREKGVEFDAYPAAEHEGGIFSAHGSAVAAGRHDLAVARVLAEFDTTVVRLGGVTIFESMTRAGARETIGSDGDLVALYDAVAKRIGLDFPKSALAVQTKNLPKGLGQIGPYVFPEAVYRKAVAVPLESSAGDVRRLKDLGVREVWTVAAAGADLGPWKAAGLAVKSADELAEGDDLFSFTARVAKRWLGQARAIDVCEPVMASYLTPLCVREGRVQICSTPSTQQAVEALPALVQGKGQRVVYNRYDGGGAKGVGDVGLFPLFKANLAFQVVEPGRPVLTVLAARPAALPQPAQSMFDLEPSDEQLKRWAGEGRILATWVLHSGEMSHDDAVINFLEFAAWKKVPIGMGVHWQRYAMEPWCVEPAHVPVEEGGALGLAEPVLHSSGHGILAESMADPDAAAEMMKEARARIAAIAGERFSPRGVYCYLDANPKDWNERPEKLWKAIRGAGFEYVLSSLSHGPNRLLYRDGDFVVLNLAGFRMYPSSPFICVKDTAQMQEVEKKLADAGQPGWLIGVLDSPLYGYGPYVAAGHKWGNFKRITEMYDFLAAGAKDRKLVLATPHTIARYARILDDRGQVPK